MSWLLSLIARYCSGCISLTRAVLACYSRIHAGHLSPEPLPRLPATQVRPVPHPGWRFGGRWRGFYPAHQAGWRIPPVHPTAPRVQVLALGYQGHSYRLRVHLVWDLRHPRVLAGARGVLADSLLPNEYVPHSFPFGGRVIPHCLQFDHWKNLRSKAGERY